MKKLWPIFLVLLVGCLPQRVIIQEDTMYKTRKYIGTLDTIVYYKHITMIYTSMAAITILRSKPIPIEKGTRCYIKSDEQRCVGSLTSYYRKRFTWDGNLYYYYLRQNHITGEVF